MVCKYQEEKMQRTFNFFGGALIGGLIGAGIAMLLAPASGEELRNQMQARAKEIELEVKNAAASKRAELEKEYAQLKAPK
jgi:gas vesicle protein